MNNEQLNGEVSFTYNREDFSVPLTNVQMEAVFKILGFDFDRQNSLVSNYSDNALVRFMSPDFKSNPFHIKEEEKRGRFVN